MLNSYDEYVVFLSTLLEGFRSIESVEFNAYLKPVKNFTTTTPNLIPMILPLPPHTLTTNTALLISNTTAFPRRAFLSITRIWNF